MEPRNLQQEIKNLEESRKIKLLGIETFDGVVTRPVVEAAIDSLQETLAQIDLDDIAKNVNKDLRDAETIA